MKPMPLAAKLRDLRLKRAESLQQVADAVGVSKAHIWELELARSANPGLDLLKKLADHFRVTVAFLSDEAVEPSEASALQFFRDFEGKLSSEDWEALRSIAKRFTDPKK